ncbi:MAG: hypothetical protein RMI30_01210 [Thermodesulfovibrio sp.]|nr:hypothetical protein [Thermodesulfovibrio sp.]MDW7998063.1 hypothetical protein [Thermodesulfovibrio sp.]
MIVREISTSIAPEEVWKRLKRIINSNIDLYELKDKINFNDSSMEAWVSHSGAHLKVKVSGNVKGSIILEINIGFPASMIYNEVEIADEIERTIRKHI